MYQNEDGIKFDPESIDIKALPFILTASDPCIMECCGRGEAVRAYTPDFAERIGADIKVVGCDSWEVRQALLGYTTDRRSRSLKGRVPMTGALDRMGGEHETLNAAIGRGAVLVKGVGAVCAGRTEAEARAAAEAVSRNCFLACRGTEAKPLTAADAWLRRLGFLVKR